MWERIAALGKNIGAILLAFLMLAVMIALTATCQMARGELRPYLPPVVRELLTDPEDEQVIDEYLHDVDDVLTDLSEQVDVCSARREQPCLTSAFEDAWRGVDSGIPVEAAWMGDAHARLRNALYSMWQIQLRSETEPITTEFMQETDEALTEFMAAVDEWYREAER
jgi:hypothetical protein